MEKLLSSPLREMVLEMTRSQAQESRDEIDSSQGMKLSGDLKVHSATECVFWIAPEG